MRLFNLGFPKSGTTTVNRALAEAGLKSAHWQVPSPGPGPVGPAIYKRYFEGDDPLRDFAAFDAITQADYQTVDVSYWPQMDYAVIRQIIRAHPDCKLVLLMRHPEKVADSIMRWGDFPHRLFRAGAPGLPVGHATNHRNILTWITGHYAVCRGMLGNYKNYVEIDIEAPDARELLAKAVGTELPWWGHENANHHHPARATSQAGV